MPQRSFRLFLLCLLLAVSALPMAVGQQSEKSTGKGKGRAKEDPQVRAASLRKLAEHLGVGAGSIIADIGAGKGRDTWTFAELVGKSGQVFAEEIEEGMTKAIEKEVGERGLSRVKAVLGETSDPSLPAGTVDLAFMHLVYHHLSKPREMLQGIWKALKPGGYFVVIDQHLGTLVDWVPREERAKKHYWIAETTVVREAREQGFLFVECAEQYWHAKDPFVLVFQRPTTPKRPDRDPDAPSPLRAEVVGQMLPASGKAYQHIALVALGEGRKLIAPILQAASGTAVDIVLEEWATQKEERPWLPPGVTLPSVLTEKGDPHLNSEPIDAVYFLDSYHLLFHGPALLAQIRERLTASGCVYVLDRPAPHPLPHREASHRRMIAPETVKEEMSQAGFSLSCELPRLTDDRFLLVFTKTSQGSAEAAPRLRAGAAIVDITPKLFPLNMPGGFSPNPAEGVHDPFHARALVLADGTITLALVVVDNLSVAQEVLDEAKAIASQQCSIPVEKMLICSTHTHSGPPSNSKEGPEPAVAYRKQLVADIAQSIVNAHAALQPAAVGAAAHPLPDEVFNRRWYLKPGKMPPNPFGKFDQVKMNPGTNPEVLDRPAGPTDPDVTVLSVQDAKRKPLAFLASYSLHYVGGAPKGLMSADYYGEFARVMPSRLHAGANFVAMMANGTSGDINNIPFRVTRPPREPFEQIRIVAQKAADTAWFAYRTIEKHQSDVRLGMLQRQIVLKLRKPDAEQIAAAKAVLAVKDEAEKAKLPRLAETYARRMLSLVGGPETITVPVQAIRIGELAVCAIPFETFVEIGLELKKRSPFSRTMVLGIANGSNGYLPTPEQHKLGGYETWLGTNRVQQDASVIITDNLLEMLKELNAL